MEKVDAHQKMKGIEIIMDDVDMAGIRGLSGDQFKIVDNTLQYLAQNKEGAEFKAENLMEDINTLMEVIVKNPADMVDYPRFNLLHTTVNAIQLGINNIEKRNDNIDLLKVYQSKIMILAREMDKIAEKVKNRSILEEEKHVTELAKKHGIKVDELTINGENLSLKIAGKEYEISKKEGKYELLTKNKENKLISSGKNIDSLHNLFKNLSKKQKEFSIPEIVDTINLLKSQGKFDPTKVRYDQNKIFFNLNNKQYQITREGKDLHSLSKTKESALENLAIFESLTNLKESGAFFLEFMELSSQVYLQIPVNISKGNNLSFAIGNTDFKISKNQEGKYILIKDGLQVGSYDTLDKLFLEEMMEIVYLNDQDRKNISFFDLNDPNLSTHVQKNLDIVTIDSKSKSEALDRINKFTNFAISQFDKNKIIVIKNPNRRALTLRGFVMGDNGLEVKEITYSLLDKKNKE